MKVACADFAFPLLEHEQSLDLIAMLGVEGVDLGMMGERTHVRPEIVGPDISGWIDRLRDRIHTRGLEVADVFFFPNPDFSVLAPNHPDSSERKRARALFQRMLDLAVGIEAKGFTLLPGINWPAESPETSLARSAEELAWRVEAGRRVGLRISIEAHVGSVVDTPRKVTALLKACPGLELTLDYTHFVYQGIPLEEIHPLISSARHLHARGGARGRLQTTLRESEIDYECIIDLLTESGYDGYFGIEYVWTPGDPPGSAYDLTNTDNLSETILLRDLVRTKSGTSV